MDLSKKLKNITDETIRLMAIVEIGKLLNSTLDLNKILEIILDTAIKNLNADRGTVYLIDHEKKQLWSKVLQGDSIVEVRLALGQGIAGFVAQTGKKIILKDAYKDPRFNPDFDKKTGYVTKSILCMPMKNRKGQMIGVFQILNKKTGFFNVDDTKFLDTLSVDACIAIENARLYEEAIEKERMEKELEVAATIQEMIIPKEIVQQEGYEIAGFNVPSKQVGGDFYDVVYLPNGNTALIIADVSGKSIPGALLVSTLQASLRAYLESDFELEKLVTKLNRIILKNSTADKYITFFIGILDPKTHTLKSVNAGHNPPLICRNGTIKKLTVGGIPLGMYPYDQYESEETQLGPNDVVVMFTDGVTEAADKDDEFYDDNRLEQCVLKNAQLHADKLKQVIFDDVKEFVGEAEQSDDITMLLLRKK
ncbi:SpoIIE family protein phosphatase [bacterium]|nr:MAG: SpoIIE family protein phosphatase [bacterium]